MNMTRKELEDLDKEIKANQTCIAHRFDPTNCSGGPISSHSIARSEQLKRIAENDKVCVWNSNISKCFHLMDESEGVQKTSFEPWTIQKASTFEGFCNHHDTLLFNLIDKPVNSFNDEVILQLHYRAMSYEYFHKKTSIEFFERVLSSDDADASPFYDVMLNMKKGNEVALNDLEKEISVCENAFPTKNENKDVKAVVFSFDVMTPVMCTGGWVPSYTIDKGKVLFQDDMESAAPLIGMTLGIDANNKSFWALTYTDDSDINIQKFLESLKKYQNKKFLDIAVLFCLQKSQNACCRPSWYNGLQKWRKKFINRGFNEIDESSHERVVGVNLLNLAYTVTQIV
jgi:hypothetical protein